MNSGEVTAAVPASDLSVAAMIEITVSNSGSASGASAPVSFLVANPKAEVTAISPQAVTAGDAVTLTVTGKYFLPGAQILWNGDALSTTVVSSTTLTAQVPPSDLAAEATVSVSASNPGPGGGPSGTSLPFLIFSGSTRMVGFPLNANDIVWDLTHGLIYASVPGANGAAGSIEAINPVTAQVTAQVAAGSDPDQLAISSDDSELWVGEDGTGSIERFALPALTSDLQFNLPLSDRGDVETAMSLQVAPGSPGTVAVLLTDSLAGSSSSESTMIYDDATPRPATVNNGFGFSNIVSIAWGADASTLYGSELGCEGTNVTICGVLDVMDVDSAGVSIANSYPGAFPYESALTGIYFHFDPSTGYLYANDGLVLNPATGDLVGTFDTSALSSTVCTVDSGQGLVFFVGQTVAQVESTSGYTIKVFDKNTYRLLGTLLVPRSGTLSGFPTRFFRWGNSGLAFITTSSFGYTPTIFLVDGKFVNSAATPDFTTGLGVDTLPNPIAMSPQSALVGSDPVTVTITGTDFTPGAQAYWGPPTNPQCGTVQTTYISPTELQATIPACDLSTVSNGYINISNGTIFTLSATQLPFTVFSTGPNPMVMNLEATSLAWDRKSGLLYAAVGSGDPQYPNSIVAINPATGAVVKSQPVGTNPSVVRVTSDGAYLYVGYAGVYPFIGVVNVYTWYQGASEVTRLQLPGLDAPLTWPLGADPATGPIEANDVEPAPGASGTVAVAGNDGSVTIFDNGVARANSLTAAATETIPYSLQWGSDASVLYESGRAISSWPLDFLTMSVDASGVSLNGTPGPISASTLGYPGTGLHYDPGTGLLYVDNGVVFDPTNSALDGQYNTGGLVAPDSSLNTTFILSPVYGDALRGGWSDSAPNKLTLASYNQKTLAPISSMTLFPIPYTGGPPSAQPVAFVRCGASCLAFSTLNPFYSADGAGSAGMLYILNDPSFVTAAP